MEGGVKQPCPAHSAEIRLCSLGVNSRVCKPRHSGLGGRNWRDNSGGGGIRREPRRARGRAGAAAAAPIFIGLLNPRHSLLFLWLGTGMCCGGTSCSHPASKGEDGDGFGVQVGWMLSWSITFKHHLSHCILVASASVGSHGAPLTPEPAGSLLFPFLRPGTGFGEASHVFPHLPRPWSLM